MRNTQQKVIAIFYLLIVIGLSFFAPLYSRSSNYLDFGPIWTNKIDWFKFGYIFFLISLFFILLFYFYRNKPSTDFNSVSFKRKVKRELKVFVFGVLAFGLFLGFIEGFNLYQENRKDKIEEEIELSLVDFAKKIKEKYPEYKNVDDIELAKKAVEKYPEYKDQIVFDDEIKENTEKINQLNSERDKLFFIKGYYYQTWLLVFGLAELSLLYVLRFLFYGVKSLTNYLKEE